MDKNKVSNLAQSFSSSCKQLVKENQFAQKVSSPATILTALAVMSVLGDAITPYKHGGWGSV